MPPGPAFGNLLHQIQEAILGKGELPTSLNSPVSKIIQDRAVKFYDLAFDKDIEEA